MANKSDQDGRDYNLGYWIVTIVLLVSPVWPVGLFLLIRKLISRGGWQSGSARRKGSGAVPGTQGVSVAPVRSAAVRPIDHNEGLGLTIGGAVMAVICGVILFAGLPILSIAVAFRTALAVLSPAVGLLLGGLAMLWAGSRRAKRARRLRKYLALIGPKESVSLGALAQAMPVSIRRACEDLQYMLDQNYLPTGYLDMGSGRLILSEEGVQDIPEPGEEADGGGAAEDEILEEIRRLNQKIDDPEMSRKIDRIGEITGKIFAYQRQNPGQAGQMRSFLNYYLPTTLKILRAYAQMESQGVEGENISAAKARIEGMMDKVVEGFEKQLDKLFQSDAMDITSDVEVLERMLEKDGLSGGKGMTLGG